MRRTSVQFVALALVAGVVLSACSSTDRMAAPVEEEVVSEQVAESEEEAPVDTDDAVVAGEETLMEPDVEVTDSVETSAEIDGLAEGTQVQASLRGVRTCVINERTIRDGKPAWIVVRFDGADRVSQSSDRVAPGNQICAEAGYSLSPFDITTKIYTMYDDTPVETLYSKNSAIGAPEMGFSSNSHECNVYRENVPRTYDDGINRFTLTRLNDTKSFKEFTVLVSDSQSRQGCF